MIRVEVGICIGMVFNPVKCDEPRIAVAHQDLPNDFYAVV
jgi:hypothetical protein